MFAALLVACNWAAVAQPAANPGFVAEPIKPGLVRVNGPGGGTLLHFDARSLVVVDSQPPGQYAALSAAIRRVTPLAPAALVLTSAGPAQAGNADAFITAGARVIAARPALQRVFGGAQAAAAAESRGVVAYDRDYLLRVGALDVHVEHVGRGRTGADSVVFFPELATLAVGELYTTSTPEPDCESGGSYAGWASAITHLMWLRFELAVPSRGAPVGKPELLAFKSRLEALAAKAVPLPSGAPGCRLPAQ